MKKLLGCTFLPVHLGSTDLCRYLTAVNSQGVV